jgi:hypothetical protein
VAVRLVADEGAEPLFATGRFMAARCAVAVISTPDGWQQVVTSEAEAVELHIRVHVRSVLGNSRQSGWIRSIDADGMSLEVAQRPGGRTLEVAVEANGFGARLACEVTASRAKGAVTMLEVRFGELTAAQRAFVRSLIAAARGPRVPGEAA